MSHQTLRARRLKSDVNFIPYDEDESEYEIRGRHAVLPGLGDQKALPVADLRALSSSPLQTFLYFMPKSFWVLIDQETNRCTLQQLDCWAQNRVAEASSPLAQLKNGYEPQETLHVIGLLVARMLCPQKRRFVDHRSMVEDGHPCRQRLAAGWSGTDAKTS
ncbi:unnamed protein product [Phytophthora fragariaefolia]|uniref:Unnamed protein product n=1 Tax=Phytophthora fragariaefolia TaxID=1490495 RepID=A0A9W6XQJ1_9STRA|nr:unnamed protein product [Phytophthora fragariaefolia]